MIFSQFIHKTNKYLKSVRVLKNYVSFDMVFPSSWVMFKKYPEGVEVLQNLNQEDKMITSFVCENNKNLIDVLEETMDTIIKTNIEREEKDKLFKSKVMELKNIFEHQDLENLKSLKFDIDELTNFIEDEESTIDSGVAEATENV
jgi:hypothetical protein